MYTSKHPKIYSYEAFKEYCYRCNGKFRLIDKDIVECKCRRTMMRIDVVVKEYQEKVVSRELH